MQKKQRNIAWWSPGDVTQKNECNIIWQPPNDSTQKNNAILPTSHQAISRLKKHDIAWQP
jgi:hypothetical protein